MATIFEAHDPRSEPRDEEVAKLRVPPHSIEAEQSVLGGLLLDNLAWDRAAEPHRHRPGLWRAGTPLTWHR